MMRNATLHLAAMALSWLVPRADRDALIGDLLEGYALRRDQTSGFAALRWYWRQIFASVPPLLWSKLRMEGWLITLGVALLAYVAVGVAQVLVHRATSGWATYSPIGLVIVFPIVSLIACAAERARRGAALVLGAAMLLAITALTIFTVEPAPTWYRIAYFVAGPMAALLGRAAGRARTTP
jgi:hypothetical protein